MTSRPVTHADGKTYRRNFTTGRKKSPVEVKAQHQMITLPPHLRQHVKNWKALTGISFSAWVAGQMTETIYIKTV